MKRFARTCRGGFDVGRGGRRRPGPGAILVEPGGAGRVTAGHARRGIKEFPGGVNSRAKTRGPTSRAYRPRAKPNRGRSTSSAACMAT